MIKRLCPEADVWDLVRAAAQDAGCRSQRAAGRDHWNEDDYNTAAREMNRLIDALDLHHLRLP